MWKSLEKLRLWTVQKLADSYVAGPSLMDALELCRSVTKFGLSSILCPWDGPGDKAEATIIKYRAALMSILREDLPCYLSVKTPAMAYNIEAARELAELGRERRVRIHFDAQEPASAAPTMRMVERLAFRYRNIGYTLPSRWIRSVEDAERVVDMGIPVRLVKGHWADPRNPGIDPSTAFLKLVNVVAGRATFVAVATHDTALAREALIRLRDAGTPCELEQLFGLPPHPARAAKTLGVKTRVYIAYGHAWLPYCLSEVRKRPEMLRWVIRDLCEDAQRKVQQLKIAA